MESGPTPSFRVTMLGILIATFWFGVCFASLASGMRPLSKFPMGCALTLVPASSALAALFWNSASGIFAGICWFAGWVTFAAAALVLLGY